MAEEQKKHMIVYSDFRGGLNVDTANDALADNELVQADNVDLLERGGIMKRQGIAPVNQESYGAQVYHLIEWALPDGSSILLAVISGAPNNTNLYKVDPLTGTLTTLATDIGYERVPWFSSKGLFFFGTRWYFDVTGYYQLKVFNGANVTQMWPDQTSETPTLSGGGSGTKFSAGTYKGICVLINDCGFEGDELVKNDGVYTPEMHVASVTLGSSQDSLNWGNLQDGSKKRLYRTACNGAVFKFVTELPAATTSYDDQVADSALGAAYVVDNNRKDINSCQYFCFHPDSQRFFAAGRQCEGIELWDWDPNIIFYSAPGRPDYWPQVNQLSPTQADGRIKGLQVFGDAVVAFYEHALWVYRGLDPQSDGKWSRVPIPDGLAVDGTQALTPDSLTFLGKYGLYVATPAILGYDYVLEPGAELVRNIANDKVTGILRNIVHRSTARAVWDRLTERYLLAYGDDPNNSHNNKILVYDWPAKAFTRYTGLQANDLLLRANGDLLMASNNYIYKMKQGYTDDGAPISMTVKTKGWDFGTPIWKRVWRMYLSLASYPELPIACDVTVDSGYATIAIPRFTWDDTYGPMTQKVLPVHMNGAQFQVTVENEVNNQPFALYSIGFTFAERPPRGVR